METNTTKKLTITVRAEGHQQSAHPHVVGQDRSAGYAAMAADEAREAEAAEWTEALLADVADEPKRNH